MFTQMAAVFMGWGRRAEEDGHGDLREAAKWVSAAGDTATIKVRWVLEAQQGLDNL
jgi:hypothetical protein